MRPWLLTAFSATGLLWAARLSRMTDVALFERRGKLRRDIGLLKMRRFDRGIDDKGRRQAVASQPGDEGLGLPVPERRPGLEPLALRTAATQPCHLGVGAGFVDEDQPVSLKPHLRLTPGDPFLARLPDVRAILLAGQQRFF